MICRKSTHWGAKYFNKGTPYFVLSIFSELLLISYWELISLVTLLKPSSFSPSQNVQYGALIAPEQSFIEYSQPNKSTPKEKHQLEYHYFLQNLVQELPCVILPRDYDDSWCDNFPSA